MDDHAFEEFVAQARRGDPNASSELLRAFEQDVRQMVRLRLPKTLRSRFDSMDFVQAVWASFFSDDGGPERFDSPQHLRAFLAGVVLAEVARQRRR